MEHKHITAAVVVLVLIIIGMFVYAYLKKAEIEETAEPTLPTPDETDSAYAGITRIDAKHFYVAPKHTLVGEIMMPTPCDLLNASVRVQESMPETAIIEFTVINNAEVCAQVLTPQRFSVSFDASEEAQIRATLQGRAVELNLIPPGPGETPEDFELFIKG